MSVFVFDLHNAFRKDDATSPVPYQLAFVTAPFENRRELSVRIVKTSGPHTPSRGRVLGQYDMCTLNIKTG